MNQKQIYKQALEMHDNPQETFVHYYYNRFYPTYNMNTEDIRELRNEYKNDLKKNEYNYRISDRAIVLSTTHGTILKSYYTEVCAILDGVFYKIWKGYSATTMKHINEYRKQNNLPALSKHEWVLMPDYQTICNEETGEIIYES